MEILTVGNTFEFDDYTRMETEQTFKNLKLDDLIMVRVSDTKYKCQIISFIVKYEKNKQGVEITKKMPILKVIEKELPLVKLSPASIRNIT